MGLRRLTMMTTRGSGGRIGEKVVAVKKKGEHIGTFSYGGRKKETK
jgi:hypothetical protein